MHTALTFGFLLKHDPDCKQTFDGSCIARTRDFFYTLETFYSSLDNQPPEYVASAPEFCEAPKFVSIVGIGSNEGEAVNRLKHNIQVFIC